MLEKLWEVGAGSVLLSVEEARDSAEGLTRIEQWPSIDRKIATGWSSKVDVCFKERSSSTKGTTDIAAPILVKEYSICC